MESGITEESSFSDTVLGRVLRWERGLGPPDCGEVWGDRQEGSHLGRCEIWKAVGRTDSNLELIFTFAQSLSRLLKMLKIQWEEAVIVRQMATYNV